MAEYYKAMETAYIKIVDPSTEMTVGGAYFEGEGALEEGNRYVVDTVGRYGSRVEYAQWGRDFNDQILGKIVLKVTEKKE